MWARMSWGGREGGGAVVAASGFQPHAHLLPPQTPTQWGGLAGGASKKKTGHPPEAKLSWLGVWAQL